jgi:hypothetical protein
MQIKPQTHTTMKSYSIYTLMVLILLSCNIQSSKKIKISFDTERGYSTTIDSMFFEGNTKEEVLLDVDNYLKRKKAYKHCLDSVPGSDWDCDSCAMAYGFPTL